VLVAEIKTACSGIIGNQNVAKSFVLHVREQGTATCMRLSSHSGRRFFDMANFHFLQDKRIQEDIWLPQGKMSSNKRTRFPNSNTLWNYMKNCNAPFAKMFPNC